MDLAPFPHRMVTLGQMIRHDPELGHAFVPSVHRRVPHERGAYFAVTNAQGFREDRDLAESPGRFHAMCYGDSFTAGDGVDNGERFSALLAARLGIVVSNVAVPGHGPDQNVLQLERRALPQPDLILWCIAVHTIERIQSDHRIAADGEGRLWRLARPYFVLADDGSLALRGVPVPERGEELVEDAFPQVRCLFAAAGREIAARWRARLVSRLGPYLKPPPDPDYADPRSTAWRLLAALVRRFHAAARGVPVALVPLPTVRYLAEDHDAHFQARFAELAAPAAGLHVLDVLTGMRSASRQQRAGFCYRLDGHYTAVGHEAVARVLAEQLQQRGLVTRGAHPVAPGSAATGNPPADVALRVGWQPGDGYAQLRAGARVLGEHTECALTARACRPGVLPLSAIHACLDDGRIAGPELREVALCSPCTVDELIRLDRGDARWFALASGQVRWLGAAETDLRRFLCYGGPVVWETDDAATVREERTPAAGSERDDDELRWLRRRLAALPRGDAGTMRRWLQRLAARWELATRAARETMLPATAPLRRGMARRVARAVERPPP